MKMGGKISGQDRKQVVIIGNCLAETMTTGMSSIADIADKFEFYAIPLHIKSLNDNDSRELLQHATYVFAQKLGVIDVGLLRSIASPVCRFVEYPDLVLRSHWPFDSNSGYRDDVAASLKDTPIRHEDGALAALRQIEPDKKKRLQKYRELDFDLAKRIDRVFEAQNRFLHDIDTITEARIGEYITQAYRENQLFYNCTHPSELVFQKLCQFCWSKIGLHGQVPPIPGMDSWRQWSVPIHPLIANRLRLKWVDKDTRYEYRTLGFVTWKEWVEAYIEYFG